MNLLVGGVAGFAAGALADRYGPRLILVVTVILAGTAFALVSVVDALWQLYLLVGLVGGVGMSSFYLLSATTIARWFDARRGLALALVLVGFNLGYISAGPAGGLAHRCLRLARGVCAHRGRLRRPRDAGRADRAVATEGEVAPGRLDARPGAAPSRGVDETGATLAQALADPRQWYLNASWLLQGASPS